MKCCRWLVLSLLVLVARHGGAASSCVPLNSSIMLFDELDAASCPAQVAAAAALGNRRVNLLFTGNFLVDAQQRPTRYCFRGNEEPCTAATPELVARLQGLWAECLRAAVGAGLDLSIYIQIDDAGPTNVWRNNLVFDPVRKYGDYSYDELFTRPLAELLWGIVRPETKVEFSLQGEMGATLAHFPEVYLDLIRLTKERMHPHPVDVGINLNYTTVLGYGTKLTPPMQTAVQRLFDAVDFVGLSAYHEVMIPVEADNFRFSHDMARDELAKLGITLPAGKRTRISEIGMGGGNFTDDGKSPAKTLFEAASALWSGIRGPYRETLDPFRDPKFRDFRRDFYRELLGYLKQPPADVNLRSAYLWNSDSWDVQGLYPATRGYEDASIIEAIRQHNAGCR